MGFWENQQLKQIKRALTSFNSAIRLPNDCSIEEDEYSTSRQLMLNIKGEALFQLDLIYRSNFWIAVLTSGGYKRDIPHDQRTILELGLKLDSRSGEVAETIFQLVRELESDKLAHTPKPDQKQSNL